MSTLSISGTSADQFLVATKAALEAFTGSPIKSDAKIRQFLTKQLSLANEHLIDSAFKATPSQNASGATVYVVTLSCIDEDGNTSIQDTLICSNADKLDAGMIKLFSQAFPHSDRGGKFILDYKDVTDRIDELAYNPLFSDDNVEAERVRLTQEISMMDSAQSLAWLIDNIDNEHLCSYLLGEFTQDRFSIQYSFSVID